MYLSDNYYTYSKGVNTFCFDNSHNCSIYEDNGSLPIKGWIYNTNINDESENISYQWTLTPSSNNDYYVFQIEADGTSYTEGNPMGVAIEFGIRPVLYLTSDIIITSGDGSIDTPYAISKP